MAGDEPVGGGPDHAEARVAQFLARRGDGLEGADAAAQVVRATVQHLALQAQLLQVGQDFQRSRERIALPGGEQQEAPRAAGQQVRQELLEDALGNAGPDIDQIECVGAEVGEIRSAQHVAALREHIPEEGFAEPGHRCFIVQARGNGINGCH